MSTIYHNFLNYCKTENYGFADLATCKKWIDYLNNFLTLAKINNKDLLIPTYYKTKQDPFFIVECFKYYLHIPEDIDGDMWVEKWGSDFVGNVNLLYNILCRVASIPREAPEWNYNGRTSWMFPSE